MAFSKDNEIFDTHTGSGYIRTVQGCALKTRHMPGFCLTERTYPTEWTSTPHIHSNALFSIALQGSFVTRYSTDTLTCEMSTVVFHAPGERHSDYFPNADSRFLMIEIEPEWLATVRDQTRIIETSAELKGGPITLLGVNLCREFTAADDVSPLIVEGLMLALIGTASRGSTGVIKNIPPHWLERAKELLHDRYTETLTLGEIASNVGVNSAYLAQMFHKHYHDTVGGYLRRLRVESTVRELASSDKSLCNIALTAGFSDQSHFTRIFKRYMGVTPAQYRKSLTGI